MLRAARAALCGARSAPRERQRLIIVGRSDLTATRYRDNAVSNAKYTAATFLPSMVVQQFSTPMALYFLVIACLQLWQAITPVRKEEGGGLVVM